MSISEKNMKILLGKLKAIIKADKPGVENTKELWKQIGRGCKFDELGFASEGDLKQFILDNPYSSIAQS